MSKLRAVIIMVLACVATAWATTIVPMSVEDLTRAASDVIEARALETWCSWNAQHTLIYTYTTFQVSRRLKGEAPEIVTVKQLGGSADGYTQTVSGVRQFQVGEQALLFLRPSIAADRTLVVVGLMQGHFLEYPAQDGATMVSNGVSGARKYDHGRIEDFGGSSMRLQDAEARVMRSTQ